MLLSNTKMIEVSYDVSKISEVKIHQLISEAGHDTEKMRAPDKVYNDLPGCCQYIETQHLKNNKRFSMNKPNYIPALRFNWLTKYYDWLIHSFLPETRFKTELLRQAEIINSYSILDFGTGTATLAIMAKQMFPETEITGLDIDPIILTIASEKIAQKNIDIDLVLYDGARFPFNDKSIDRVISSLVFHHINRQQKIKALEEIKRVLKPGGELHIADWGKPSNILMRALMYPEQWLDGYENTIDNIKGHFPELIKEVGFSEVTETKRFSTIFGTLSLYKAKKYI